MKFALRRSARASCRLSAARASRPRDLAAAATSCGAQLLVLALDRDGDHDARKTHEMPQQRADVLGRLRAADQGERARIFLFELGHGFGEHATPVLIMAAVYPNFGPRRRRNRRHDPRTAFAAAPAISPQAFRPRTRPSGNPARPRAARRWRRRRFDAGGGPAGADRQIDQPVLDLHRRGGRSRRSNGNPRRR